MDLVIHKAQNYHRFPIWHPVRVPGTDDTAGNMPNNGTNENLKNN